MSVDASEKPLRRDAERNRRRILDAARELFAERGLSATLNDVAHRAGVGVGTVYRRFPDKAVLVETLFEEGFAEVVQRMQRALEDPDPWRGLVGFLEGNFRAQCESRALTELMTESPQRHVRFAAIRERLLPMSEELVHRAQASGALRADIAPADLALLQVMIGSVLDASRDVDPALWRRYVTLALRGMSARPQDISLPAMTLEPEQIDAVLAAHKRSRPD